uniref:AAA_11 domain-containing protein n=1 Tax=Panagrellus redivivus TaxID=6233 RepID=A0A7E4UL47_PANRE
MLAENKVLSAKKPFTTKSFNFQPYSADHIHEHETNWEDIRKPITNDFSLTVKLFDNAIRTALKITEEAVFETAFDECGRFKFTLKEVQRHGKVTAIIKIESASEDEIHGDNNLKFNINDYIYIFTYKFVKNKRRRENIAVGYITGITKAEIRIGLFKEAVDNKTKAKVLEEFCHEMVGLSLKVNYSMYNSQLQSLEVLKAHRFVQEKLGYAMHDFSSHQRNDNANDTDLERAFKAMTRKTYSTFVLTGPPGTGKTTVMIEAILELVKQKKRVLIATKSNAAADTFTNRFLQHFNDAKRVFRLMSERHEPSQYNDNIKRISGIFFNKNTNLWDYKLVLTKTNDG